MLYKKIRCSTSECSSGSEDVEEELESNEISVQGMEYPITQNIQGTKRLQLDHLVSIRRKTFVVT